MNVEILEFYPSDRKNGKDILTGTLRAKLPDLGMHILGIYVSKKKDAWFFMLPGRNTTHHETGELIRYPFIAFEDKEKQKSLMEAIREKGKAFVEEYTKNHLIENAEAPRKTEEKPVENKIIEQHLTKVPSTTKIKVWDDVPPLKFKRKQKVG